MEKDKSRYSKASKERMAKMDPVKLKEKMAKMAKVKWAYKTEQERREHALKMLKAKKVKAQVLA